MDYDATVKERNSFYAALLGTEGQDDQIISQVFDSDKRKEFSCMPHVDSVNQVRLLAD